MNTASEALAFVYRCVPTAAEDMRLLIRVLNAAHPVRDLRCVTVPGNPRPKRRPRFTSRGHAFVPKDERLWAARMRAMLQDSGVRRDDGPVAVAMLLVRADRRRADVDNLQKAWLDIANGVLFRDDSQVASLHADVIVDPASPRTVIAVASIR